MERARGRPVTGAGKSLSHDRLDSAEANRNRIAFPSINRIIQAVPALVRWRRRLAINFALRRLERIRLLGFFICVLFEKIIWPENLNEHRRGRA